MNKTKKNYPAFPINGGDRAPYQATPFHGLTKRELIAAIALGGLFADPELSIPGAVSASVVAADMLIAELDKPAK